MWHIFYVNINSDNITDIEQAHLESLASDEDYWDYLDRLEYDMGGCREFDCPVAGGAC